MASAPAAAAAPVEAEERRPGTSRPVAKTFTAHSQREGAGFTVRRPVGGPFLSDEQADPFLLLDELGPQSYAPGEFPGAPWHPHRGFDTVMYLLSGVGDHRDSMGNSGRLVSGDVQWMTAGSGIIHDEGRNHPGGELHGFQMWVNLPAANKMSPPAYQDVPAASIPTLEVAPGVTAKVIAGECAGVRAVVQTLVPIQYIDFTCAAGSGIFAQQLAPGMETCLLFVFRGGGRFGPGLQQAAKDGDCVVMGTAGDLVEFQADPETGMRLLFLAGTPIKEPIVRHGPFVMNTRQEIMEAMMDYQAGPEVFCKAKGSFKSEF